MKSKMKITCISDTHGLYPTLPGGDILIHAGDCTTTGTQEEYDKFHDWIFSQPYRRLVVVAGNHDEFYREISGEYSHTLIVQAHGRNRYIDLLLNGSVIIDGYRIHGTPSYLTFDEINP